jgi:hypothetical protein
MRLTTKQMLAIRLLLLALIGEGLVIGIQALFVPHYFYEHFLLGADWMPALGPYSQEMTVTAGALYLGLSVPAIVALLKPAPRLLQAVGVANVFAAFPHMVFHLMMANMSGAETIPQADTLGLTVIAGIALVVIARNGERRFFQQRLAATSRGFVVAPDEPVIDPGRQQAVQVVLGALLAEFLLIGFWALFMPDSFYRSFPFGTSWVSELGAYSEHLTVDTGALSFGFASAVVLAMAWKSAILVRSLAWGVALATIAETIYHLTEVQRSGALATLVQAGVLFLTAAASLYVATAGRPARPLAIQPQAVAEPARPN